MTENPKQAGTESAFPLPDNHWSPGLTKAEYFAAIAMHSLLLADKGISTDRLVVDSYNIGLAMARRGEGHSGHPKA
jgi:hypothetical protein